MALTDENGGNFVATMPMAPAYGGGNGWGNGFGNDGWWILLLLLCGWGNGFGGGWGMGGFGGGLGIDFPWILNGQNAINANTNAGFDHAATQAALGDLNTAVTSGFGNVATQLCGGFAGVNATVNSGFANAETAANARQMANMNQAFAAQTAMSQGFNALGTQLADCCCENRLASADLKYTIATENCADRAAFSDGIRDVIANQTAGVQRILDQLCNDKIDAKNEKIADLERQLTMANLQASQVAQNAFISQGFANEVDALYNRLNACPVPTTPVYGRTPIFQCNNQNTGCGCGCTGNF